MCGVVGIWDRRRKSAPAAVAAVAEAMTDTLRHRGPDEGAIFADAGGCFALGHRRLSIVELSPAGAQPMISSCGRFIVSYNGEVYNAAELRISDSQVKRDVRHLSRVDIRPPCNCEDTVREHSHYFASAATTKSSPLDSQPVLDYELRIKPSSVA